MINWTGFAVPTNMTSFTELLRYDQSVSPFFGQVIVGMVIALAYITLRRWGVEQAGGAAMFAGMIVGMILWLLSILSGTDMIILIVAFGLSIISRWLE
jgi:hypothetical protein